MSTTKKSSLLQTLLLSVLIFCAWIPLLFLSGVFSDVKQQLTEGYVTRGGGFLTCSAGDYDPRNGGQICDGETEFIDEPLEFITLEQAIGERFLFAMRGIWFVPIALIFGFYFHRQQVKEERKL